MEIPLQITSRNLELDGFFREEIRERAEKLERVHDRITRCRVVVEVPHRHKKDGIHYNVKIEMTVPGGELVVKREPNEDLSVAIRDAFDAARRKLEETTDRQRREVKRHEGPPVAKITSLFQDKGYGFITTPDGREIYFHRNSVLKQDFQKLKLGMEVRFAEEQGDKGPQASTVTVIGG